ncbi:MAG: hypothetical protein EpisKO_15430 [Epibacterium sp.]
MHLFLFLVIGLSLFPRGASAEPISAAIVAGLGAAGITVTAAAVTSFLVNTALSFGLSLLSQALAKRNGREDRGVRIEGTTVGEDVPQKFTIGRYITGGHLEYHGSFGLPDGGPPNKWYVRVFSLSDVPGVRLRRLMIADEWMDLGEVSGAHWAGPILNYRKNNIDYAYLRFYDGTQTEADSLLVEHFANHPEHPWTSEHVGQGIAYAVVMFHVDREQFSGIPQCKFELDGAPLYDPRKDTSVGGLGAHRHDDPSTWEPSENLAVQAYNLFRGIPLPDGSVYGGNLAAEDVPFSNWVAGMNECDVEVDGRPQFTGGLEINVDEEPATYIEELLAAGLGQVSEVGGIFRCRWGSPDTPILSFSDDDISISDPQKFDPFPGLEETYNSVRVTHPSPDHLWEPIQTPANYNDAWEAEDGGRRLPVQMSVPACFDHAQAQQIAAGYALDHRRWRRHTLTLPPDAFDLSALDTVSWTSARNGYVNKIFEVVGISYRPFSLFCDIQLRERDPSDYSWSGGQELPAPPIAIPVTPTDRVVDTTEWSFVGVSLRDSEGNDRRPALRITLAENSVEDADALDWQIELVADESRVASGSVRANEEIITIAEGILPGVDYRARVRPRMPGRTSWSGWKVATAPDVRIAPDLLDATVWDTIAQDAQATASALDADLVSEVIQPLSRDLELRAVEQRTMAEAVAMIGDQVLWAITRLSDVDGRFADAGIVQDPETGKVRIYALEQEAERISEAEIRLSAAEASIALSATEAWVRGQITEAMLDPTQIPLVEDLQLQVNEVELELDAINADLALSASQTEVDGLGARLSTAEANLDAAETAISLKAEQSQLESLQGRVQTAEVQISALDGPQLTQTVADTRYLLDADELAAEQTLASLLQAHAEGERIRQSIAYATEDLRARITEDREAVAALSVQIGASISNAMALIEAESLARASEDEAIAEDLLALDARLSDAEGNVTAQANAQTQLTTRVSEAEGQLSAQAASVEALNTRLQDAEGNITTQADAQTQLTTRVSDAENALSAQAQSVQTLSTTVGQNTTTVQTVSESVDGMSGRHMLRVNSNGVATGMVIAAEAGDNGAVSSTIAFAADSFSISPPSGAGAVSPFVFYATPRVIDGILFPAGLYVENAYLGRAMIGRGQITDTLQSDDYAESNGRPTQGVKINFKTGKVKTAGLVISRPLRIAQGTFTATGPCYNGARWAFVNTGIRVGKNDVWEASQVALVASAAITSAATAPSGFDPNNSFWTLRTEIQPGARWNGFGGGNPAPANLWSRDPNTLVTPWWSSATDQRLYLAISLETLGGVYFNNPKIEWAIFEVT